MAECRSCNAPIRWALTVKNGKHIPIDVEPVPDGNLVIEHRNGGDEARPATDTDKKLMRPLFKSHFATCPQSPSWRRKD